MQPLKINNTLINNTSPTYIIAELSANHVQDFDIAMNTIRAMKESGADAVKIQSYLPESIALDADKPWFRTRKDSPWAGNKLVDLYKKGYTPWEWHTKLRDLAHELGMDFFSSPFDLDMVDKLESINMPAYKIASLEITDIPLIKKVAQTGKPIIMSTGAAGMEDIDLAVKTCLDEGNDQIALLKCTSAYPTPLEEVNLTMIPTLKKRYGCIVGLSDHTPGSLVPIGSVALGAKIIEKHFILSKDLDSLDGSFSLDPIEFKAMVDAVRSAELTLGDGSFDATPRLKNAQNFTRSLYAVKDIRKGETLTAENVRTLRPHKGLHPKHYEAVLGKIAKNDIERGTPLAWELIQ